MEESVSAFLDHITQQRQLSANTRAAYQNDLSQLTRFFRAQGVEDWKADRAWVECVWRGTSSIVGTAPQLAPARLRRYVRSTVIFASTA